MASESKPRERQTRRCTRPSCSRLSHFPTHFRVKCTAKGERPFHNARTPSCRAMVPPVETMPGYSAGLSCMRVLIVSCGTWVCGSGAFFWSSQRKRAGDPEGFGLASRRGIHAP